MNHVLLTPLAALILFLAIVALLEVGRRLGLHHLEVEGKEGSGGFGAIEGAIFGLMGLLIAFTFSGAAERFEARRHLIVEEANSIGTAYLRIDLLPASAQSGLREDFRNYLDARLGFYRDLNRNNRAALRSLALAQALQGKIWQASVAACQQENSNATTSLVLSAVNEMIDVSGKRVAALENHPPEIIYWALGFLVLASSLFAGYAMAASRRRSAIHTLIFAAVLSITFYGIVDLESPRSGLIRIDRADHILVELRNSMR